MTCEYDERVRLIRKEIMGMSVTEVARRIADSESTAPRIRIHVDERRAIGHDECGRCGATVGATDRFCRMCGSMLGGCL